MEAALEAHAEATAAMVFTPSYYGTSADVRALAGACHARGIPLVTDDAWALDYAFVEHPDLPEGALSQGADLAIGSVHKTLSGFSQTSVLSMRGNLVDPERLSLCFELQESTSVSTLMLLGIDAARRQFVREGYELLDRAVRMAKLARERLADEVPELYVVDSEELGSRPGVVGVDPTHLLIEVAPVGLTGYEATHWLKGGGTIPTVSELNGRADAKYPAGTIFGTHGDVRTVGLRQHGRLEAVPGDRSQGY
jgi:arginine decarboxylase